MAKSGTCTSKGEFLAAAALDKNNNPTTVRGELRSPLREVGDVRRVFLSR